MHLLPATLDEALWARAAHPEATVVAGGTGVMVARNRDGADAPLLDLSGVVSLRAVEAAGDVLRLGAGVTYTQAIQELDTVLPDLAAAARTVASPQIRNRGTLAGALVLADPSADALAVLGAAGATVRLRRAPASGAPGDGGTVGAGGAGAERAGAAVGAHGGADPAGAERAGATVGAHGGAGGAGAERVVTAVDFVRGPGDADLAADELVVGLDVPLPRGPVAYAKVGARNAMARAVCGVAVRLDPSAQLVRVCLVGVAPRAVVAELPWDTDGAVQVTGLDDARGSAAHRRHVARVMTQRALARAREELGAWR